MQPLVLTLKGFRGIRDGLGRDELKLDFEQLAGDAELVAIAGANGRGKSTILDNMTPYPVMPSRAGADGLGSFSYYEHVYLPESLKELVWEHGGQRYRSTLVLRLNAKKRTEAFLHVRCGDAWTPVKLDDGTVSDGKVDTYERCVEGVLGSAATFFTSVFAAQGRRQLSAYRNNEIKTLLADLLGLEEIRATGTKAAEITRLVRTGLLGVRSELTAVEGEMTQNRANAQALGDTERALAQCEAERAAATARLDEAKSYEARLAAEHATAAQTERRRADLQAERKAAGEASYRTQAGLDQQDAHEVERLKRLRQRAAQRMAADKERRQRLERQRTEHTQSLAAAGSVAHAQRRLTLAELVTARREARVEGLRSSVERLNAVVTKGKLTAERIAGLEREAGKATLRDADLRRQFGLTQQVPCAGTSLQRTCKLLKDARDAQTHIPGATAEVTRLAQARQMTQAKLDELRAEARELANEPRKLAAQQQKLERSRRRSANLGLLAARAGESDQASNALRQVTADLAALPAAAEETEDEKAQRLDAEGVRARVARQKAESREATRETLERIDRALADLAAALDAGKLQEAQRDIEHQRAAVKRAEEGFVLATRANQAAIELRRRAAALEERAGAVRRRIGAIEAALSAWALFARCVNNDGVIALAIDDSGPALAGLANDLLLACYGPRFTVSIKTLIETAKGEAREGFDIVVHDAETGESKSVDLMSGGERTWTNESLTRAIALYLVQNSGRRYETLFSDEADGALDPERKRMFIATKREVLRLGGYRKEFFVSQTPELTAAADAIIDLDKLTAHQPVGIEATAI